MFELDQAEKDFYYWQHKRQEEFSELYKNNWKTGNFKQFLKSVPKIMDMTTSEWEEYRKELQHGKQNT